MAFPYGLTRIGVLMEPEAGNPLEVEGVLNPASGRDSDGMIWLLPRLVAKGNWSRVGRARIVVGDGIPGGVIRDGVALEPERQWERGAHHGGTEDPRVTWVPALGLHLMTYVANGPLGPKLAFAVSRDLRTWDRLGPCLFDYAPALDTDLNLYWNKDAAFFPEPIRRPDGTECIALLHRPMWDLGLIRPSEGVVLPAGVTDPREGIWISYTPLAGVRADIRNLVRMGGHRLVAQSLYPFEKLKIGSGPPPVRVPEGWLLIHHGVSGKVIEGLGHLQTSLIYAAGGMILDEDDPGTVLLRSAEPLLSPQTDYERHGTVPNVIFPTAIESIGGRRFVFYGMADSRIGVAELKRS